MSCNRSEDRGELFRPSARVDTIFSRILTESSGYYLLTFEPIASDRNGRRHDIALETTRREITLRARPSFTLPRVDR